MLTRFASLIALLSSLLAAPAWAATIYVDNGSTGCSAPSDTDYTPATRTCGSGSATVYNSQRGGMKAAASLDTVIIRAGDYTAEAIFGNSVGDLIASGTSWPSNVTTIRAETGETVLSMEINLGADTEPNVRQYVTFSGLTFDGEPFQVTRWNHIRLTNSVVKNAPGSGVVCTQLSSFVWIDNNNIHNNGDSSTPQEHGIYCYGTDHLIEYNTVNDNHNYGIHVYSGVANQTDRAVIRNNKVFNNGTVGATSFGIIASSGDDIRVYNNLVYDNTGGIQVAYGSVSNAKVYNNTIYDNTKGGVNAGGLKIESATDTIARNNIIYSNTPDISDSGTGSVLSNNLTTDPRFADAANKDFKLCTAAGVPHTSCPGASGAIDAGFDLSGTFTIDYAGATRPQGAAFDIGAYEAPVSGSGLVSWWKLDENTGTNAADSQGTSAGTLTNGPTWATGKVNFGLSFVQADSEHVLISSTHLITTTDWAISAWVKRGVGTGDRVIFATSDNNGAANSGAAMWLDLNGKLKCYASVGTNSEELTTSTATVSDTAYEHLVCVKSGTSLKGYINKVEDGAITLSTSTMDWTGDAADIETAIGRVKASAYFDGSIDEVRLYNRALNQAEIDVLFNPAGGGGLLVVGRRRGT